MVNCYNALLFKQMIDFQHFSLLGLIKAVVLLVEKSVQTCHKAQRIVLAEEFPAGALRVGS